VGKRPHDKDNQAREQIAAFGTDISQDEGRGRMLDFIPTSLCSAEGHARVECTLTISLISIMSLAVPTAMAGGLSSLITSIAGDLNR
jgi:hypothetical protein